MNSRIAAFLIVLGLLAVYVGCEKGSTSNPTKEQSTGLAGLRIYLSDSPIEFDEVNIVISEVQVHSEGGGWIVINDSTRTFNLLSLTNGAAVLLGEAALDPGHYTQIRLILGEGSNVVVGGEMYPLKIPSGLQTGIKLIHDFKLQADYTYELMLDFDASKSIHRLGNGRYQMKPVIRAHSVAASGAIAGMVAPIGAGATITATAPNDTASTFADSLSGEFKLIALTPNQFMVYFAAWDTTLYRDTALVNVAVSAGQTTDVGVIELPHK